MKRFFLNLYQKLKISVCLFLIYQVQLENLHNKQSQNQLAYEYGQELQIMAGIELNLVLLNQSDFFEVVRNKKHEIASMSWSISKTPAYWQHYHSDNAHRTQTNNITNTDDKKLDALIMSYRKEINIKKRIKLSLEIQQRLHDICSFIPTFMVPYFRQAYWLWWRLPEDYATKKSDNAFDAFNAEFGGLFWLDKKLEKDIKTAMQSGKKLFPTTIIDKKYAPKRLMRRKTGKNK